MDQGRKVDGGALRRLRRFAWISQEELARESGVHVVSIYKIEAGKVETPRKATIVALAKALGVRPELLLQPEEDEGGDRPIDKVLREQQRRRDLMAISPPDSPHVGRYGAAWDYLGDAEVDDAAVDGRVVVRHAG